ncbi:hydroxymethylpyrimidine/phosphomethylpyrimidine kinase, partial [Eisenbergiella massiliensis]
MRKRGGKSSAHQRVRILLRKTRRQILCSPKGSHFASQNKEDWYSN